MTLAPELNDRALALLIEALEGHGPDAWRAERMGERYARLVPRIVAFRAEVLSVHATFKLGQDEDEATFSEIVAGVDDRELARLMVDQRRG
ncbi:MAG: hypothetical protein WDM92_02370 [Caulobacteraceae bacterium]